MSQIGRHRNPRKFATAPVPNQDARPPVLPPTCDETLRCSTSFMRSVCRTNRYRPRARARAIGLGVHERRGRSSRRELSGRGEGHRGGLARPGGRGGGGGCGGGLGRAMTERFFVRIFPCALWVFSIWAHVFVSPCVCLSHPICMYGAMGALSVSSLSCYL